MKAQAKFTKIHPVRKVEIHYEQENSLFGLIKGWRQVKKNSIGEALYVRVDRVPEDIFINGIKYTPSESDSDSVAQSN